MRGGVTRRLSDCRWRECTRDLRRKPCAPRSMSHWSWLGPLDRRRKRQAPGSEQTSRYSAHPIPRDVQPTPTRKPSASDFPTNSCPLLLHSVLLFQGWVEGGGRLFDGRNWRTTLGHAMLNFVANVGNFFPTPVHRIEATLMRISKERDLRSGVRRTGGSMHLSLGRVSFLVLPSLSFLFLFLQRPVSNGATCRCVRTSWYLATRLMIKASLDQLRLAAL